MSQVIRHALLAVRHRSSLVAKNALLPLIALLAVTALAFGVAPRYANTRAGGDNSPLAGLFDSFAPHSISFGPNVRANSDTTANGQHEPSLAVSRVNTN